MPNKKENKTPKKYKTPEPKNMELNDFSAATYLPISEGYHTTQKTYAKVLAIDNDKIIAKVLVDESTHIFQERAFDIEPFKDLHLYTNDLVEIQIFTKPGEQKFIYKKIKNTAIEKIFVRKEYFKGLENSRFFKPLSTQNENNI